MKLHRTNHYKRNLLRMKPAIKIVDTTTLLEY